MYHIRQSRFQKINTIKYKEVYLIMISGVNSSGSLRYVCSFYGTSNCENQKLTDIDK